MFQRVLVTTDFSDIGNRAVSYAFNVLSGMNCTIYICNIDEIPKIPSPLYAHYSSEQPVSQEELNKREAETRKKLIALQPPDLEKLAINVEVLAVETHSHVHEKIIELANELNVDCIIMSTRGMSGLANFIIGSTTKETVASSNIPVLVVPANYGELPEEM